MICEAKYRSVNARQPNHPRYPLYNSRGDLIAASPPEIAQQGYYELVREWRIGDELRDALGCVRFVLLNLGPRRLGPDVDQLLPRLKTDKRQSLEHADWTRLLDPGTDPGWLTDYALERAL